MISINESNFILLLQTSISPAILISGVGLLILSLTNRFGRVIDRSRALHEKIAQATDRETRVGLSEQLSILSRRALLIRNAILFAVLSILLTALLIFLLFASSILQMNFALIMVFNFLLILLSIIVSLIFFLSDINVSLKAIHIELKHSTKYFDE